MARQLLPAISRRSLLKTSAGFTASAALGSQLIQRAAAKGSNHLTVWGIVSFTPEGDALLGQQMKDWGKKNGIDVEYDPINGSSYLTKLATAVEANAVPDIAMMEANSTFFYVANDHLVDLTDVYNDLKGLGGGMFTEVLPQVQVGDKVYSIPFEVGVPCMYARLDLIEKATGKREPPKTFDELEAMAKKINKPPQLYGIGLTCGRTPDAVGNIETVIFSEGGTLVDENGKPAINNKGTVAALTRVKRWWDEKLIPPNATSWDDSGNNTAYQSGQAAFVFNPASIFAWLEKNDPTMLKNTAQAPPPSGPAGSFPGIDTWSWSIFANSQNVDAAKELIKAIMQPDQVEAVYEKVGGRWYPIYHDLTTAPYWKSRPYFDFFPQIIKSGRPEWYPAKGSATVVAQISAVDQQFVLADMLQDVLISGTSPADAAKKAQTKMEQVFAQVAQK